MMLVVGHANDRDQRKRRRTPEYKLQLKIGQAFVDMGQEIYQHTHRARPSNAHLERYRGAMLCARTPVRGDAVYYNYSCNCGCACSELIRDYQRVFYPYDLTLTD